MPTPLPTPDVVDLVPPTVDEVAATARGVMGAVSSADGPTELQRVLVQALFAAMTGHHVDVDDGDGLGPADLGMVLQWRNEAFRRRVVQTMALGALVLVPLPESVADRIDEYAAELGVSDESLRLARSYATGSLGLAVIDFDRNGYRERWDADIAEQRLHTAHAVREAWAFCVGDPALAQRWAALGDLPEGTLGRRVWEFYRARGFVFPGLPGSAPPYLAQHDWVHVLADYGTTVESEIEVFGFVARATDDPRGFSLLAMVVGLFETGYVPAAVGLFQADPGHLARQGMAVRLGDAMRRGALAHPPDAECPGGDVRFLDVDWFEHADLPLAEARERFGVVDKSSAALAAGAVGPWEPGGISPFQERAGTANADAEGRPYDGYGARNVT